MGSHKAAFTVVHFFEVIHPVRDGCLGKKAQVFVSASLSLSLNPSNVHV